MKNYNYIVIEGNIGAGKTTLAKMIAERFDARLILERFFDNPFLPMFYSDPEKYSFPLELSFLAERYHQLNEDLRNRDLFHPITIADYYLMKSLIFSKTNLSEDEYHLYRQIFDIISANAVKPDLYVYLHLSLDKLVANIKNRGDFMNRKFKKNICLKFTMDIWIFKKQIDLTIVMIDINDMDFFNKEADFEKVIDIVFNREYTLGVTKVIP